MWSLYDDLRKLYQTPEHIRKMLFAIIKGSNSHVRFPDSRRSQIPPHKISKFPLIPRAFIQFVNAMDMHIDGRYGKWITPPVYLSISIHKSLYIDLSIHLHTYLYIYLYISSYLSIFAGWGAGGVRGGVGGCGGGGGGGGDGWEWGGGLRAHHWVDWGQWISLLHWRGDRTITFAIFWCLKSVEKLRITLIESAD